MKRLKQIALFSGVALITACSSQDKSLYYWGDYSDSVYAYYNQSGDLAKQEQALQATIQQAQTSGKNVAPGIYGHLGLVLLKQGKRADANTAFQQEKALYPESAQFIQYLQSKTK